MFLAYIISTVPCAYTTKNTHEQDKLGRGCMGYCLSLGFENTHTYAEKGYTVYTCPNCKGKSKKKGETEKGGSDSDAKSKKPGKKKYVTLAQDTEDEATQSDNSQLGMAQMTVTLSQAK